MSVHALGPGASTNMTFGQTCADNVVFSQRADRFQNYEAFLYSNIYNTTASALHIVLALWLLQYKAVTTVNPALVRQILRRIE